MVVKSATLQKAGMGISMRLVDIIDIPMPESILTSSLGSQTYFFFCRIMNYLIRTDLTVIKFNFDCIKKYSME